MFFGTLKSIVMIAFGLMVLRSPVINTITCLLRYLLRHQCMLRFLRLTGLFVGPWDRLESRISWKGGDAKRESATIEATTTTSKLKKSIQPKGLAGSRRQRQGAKVIQTKCSCIELTPLPLSAGTSSIPTYLSLFVTSWITAERTCQTTPTTATTPTAHRIANLRCS